MFLKDSGYSATVASRYLSILLTASLGGRVVVGYIADRFSKSFIMAIFYFLIGASVLLLAHPQSTAAIWAFALIFGFSMGADYMLIPLVVSENFGTASLGKILALIIMGYSVGQWAGPWFVGRTLRHPSQLRPRVEAHRDFRDRRIRSNLRDLPSARAALIHIILLSQRSY